VSPAPHPLAQEEEGESIHLNFMQCLGSLPLLLPYPNTIIIIHFFPSLKSLPLPYTNTSIAFDPRISGRMFFSLNNLTVDQRKQKYPILVHFLRCR
jgi:hypothetical protein